MTDSISCPLSETEIRSLTLDEAIARSHWLINRAKARYSPVATVSLLSGGNDSTIATHLALPHIDSVAHINTGIGVEETRAFVRETVKGWGKPLIEEHPPPGCTYDELVLKYGFPGPAGHQMMYSRLKERGLRQVRRRYITDGRRQRVLFLAGMRLLESSRRWRNAQEMDREGSTVWCSPLVHWTAELLEEYRNRFNVPRNEVSDHLHMSGECLCGAFAKPGEIHLLEMFYPDTAARIRELEQKAKNAGVHCRWGTRPPRKVDVGAPQLFDPDDLSPGPLCVACAEGVES